MSESPWNRFAWSVVATAVVLMGLGLLGLARAAELSGGSYRYVVQQAVWAGLGTAVLVGLPWISYRAVCRWSYAIFTLVVGLLIAVYFVAPVNGAHRWLRLGPLGIQPSEFAKVAFVMALARYLMHRANHRSLTGLLLPVAGSLVPVLLILREPDLGTSLVFLPVLAVMLLVAGARRRDLLCCLGLGLLMVPLLWSQMSREQRSRVTALLEQTGPGQTPRDDGYQLHQGKQMLALGGVWGSVLGGQAVDDPAVYTLPEGRTDFIFCVLGERLGLWGLALVLGLFGFLAWRGCVIAGDCQEPCGRLLAVGIVALLGVQVLINTGMTVGLLPVTGLSLPLVSYGGSGLLAQCTALGLLLSVGLRPGYEMSGEAFRFEKNDER